MRHPRSTRGWTTCRPSCERRGARPVLFGWSEGASIAAVYAATHPNRVRRLVLYGAYLCALGAHDYQFGFDPAAFDEWQLFGLDRRRERGLESRRGDLNP
jgi:pimeloyl-ACP methyl ester carboxylesterase